MKSGADHLRSLDDGRCVLLDGGRVGSVPNHPAFRNAACSIAGPYDHQCAPANLERMTFEVPGTGRRVNRAWELPTSYDALVSRRMALTEWAEQHHGYMGRSPDHVASTLSAMFMGQEVYDRHDGGRSGPVHDYYKYARDNDLYVTYVIIDPQGDRSKGTSEAQNASLAVSIVDEDSGGITVRGSKMLGTGTVLSNEVLVTTLRPLKPDESCYAFTAVVPVGHKGVKLLSRRSYEQAATSEFDYPLSTRFDENDALLYFDDCRIPWDRVFVHCDPVAQLAQWHETPAHSYQNYQACIRLTVKLRFLLSLARRIAETVGTTAFGSVQQTLGELAADAAMIEAFVADHRLPLAQFLKSPLDQVPSDAWTCFPGDAQGNVAQILAAALFRMISGCDAAIDVHTPTRGGRYVPIAILPGPDLAASVASRALGEAMGTGWVVAGTEGMYVAPGVLCVEVARAGIPALTFEIGEGGRLEEECVAVGARCILNGMRHLGMLDSPADLPVPGYVMRGFLGLRAGQGGLLTTVPELGAAVRRGDMLCRISGVFGDVLEEIAAPQDGLFVRATTMGTVSQGERVATLGLL